MPVLFCVRPPEGLMAFMGAACPLRKLHAKLPLMEALALTPPWPFAGTQAKAPTTPSARARIRRPEAHRPPARESLKQGLKIYTYAVCL